MSAGTPEDEAVKAMDLTDAECCKAQVRPRVSNRERAAIEAVGRFGMYCVDHEAPLHNWGQIEAHIETTPPAQDGKPVTHTFVRLCRVHGWPESLDERQQEMLIPYQQLESGL